MLNQAALLVRSGFRAREAIARALDSAPDTRPSREAVDASAEALAAALVAGDPQGALAALRGLESVLGLERALEDRVLPALRLIGEGWRAGRWSVAQEHTATGLVLSWLGAVRSGQVPVKGPLKVLIATPAGEHHAVAVWVLELLLRRRGVAALALGSDVPHEALVSELETRRPLALVLAATHPDALPALRRAEGAARAASVRIFVGGPAAELEVGDAERLPGSLTAAADWLGEVVERS